MDLVPIWKSTPDLLEFNGRPTGKRGAIGEEGSKIWGRGKSKPGLALQFLGDLINCRKFR